jgi:hypothetical protein
MLALDNNLFASLMRCFLNSRERLLRIILLTEEELPFARLFMQVIRGFCRDLCILALTNEIILVRFVNFD